MKKFIIAMKIIKKVVAKLIIIKLKGKIIEKVIMEIKKLALAKLVKIKKIVMAEKKKFVVA